MVPVQSTYTRSLESWSSEPASDGSAGGQGPVCNRVSVWEDEEVTLMALTT